MERKIDAKQLIVDPRDYWNMKYISFIEKKVSLLSLKFRSERFVLINYQISILCNLQLHLSFDRF